jgi:hypothetical protein
MSSKTGDEVVTAREFDITGYTKNLSASIGVVAGATAAALKLFGNAHITSGIVAAGLGVTAVALLGICFISAVDIAARAYVTRGLPKTDPKPDAGCGCAGKPDPKPEDPKPAPPSPLPIGAVSRRVLVWLEGESQPRLVLAVAGDGEESKYLLSGDEIGERDQGEGSVPSLEGPPAWHDAKEVRAVKSADWPPREEER